MSQAIKLALIFICATGFYAASTPRRPGGRPCKISRARVEGCANDVLLFGNRKIQFPRSMDEGWQLCERVTKGIDCISKYRSCVTGIKRNLVGSFVSITRTAAKGICNEEILPSFLQQTTCLDKEKVLYEEFIKCYDRSVIQLDYTLAKVPSIDRFSAVCCIADYYRECYRRFTSQICAPTIGEESSQFLEHFMDKFYKSMPSCSDKYATVRACAQNLPEHNKKFAEVDDDFDVPPQNHTVLLTILDIFSD